MAGHQEIEVKFRVASLDETRRRLGDLGAELIGRSHEANLCFDDEAGRLRAAGELLRLRRDRRATLTYKSPPAESAGERDARFKVRREIEVEVGSFEEARALLEALGYRVAAHYEKERETWRYGGATILLDSLSFGSFVELEGEPAAIERVARSLGFDLAEGITVSYLDLLERSQEA